MMVSYPAVQNQPALERKLKRFFYYLALLNSYQFRSCKLCIKLDRFEKRIMVVNGFSDTAAHI